jgi:hypothetical protein
MPKKQGGKSNGYYDAHKAITAGHKREQAAKRQENLDYWLAKGVQKNGKKILTLEQRAAKKSSGTIAPTRKKIIWPTSIASTREGII